MKSWPTFSSSVMCAIVDATHPRPGPATAAGGDAAATLVPAAVSSRPTATPPATTVRRETADRDEPDRAEPDRESAERDIRTSKSRCERFTIEALTTELTYAGRRATRGRLVRVGQDLASR